MTGRLWITVPLLLTTTMLLAGDEFMPPPYLILPCEGDKPNVAIVGCTGTPPYREMTCSFTRLAVGKQDRATSQKNKATFLASTTESLSKAADSACEDLAKQPEIVFSKFAPEVRALRERAQQRLRDMCTCKGKGPECVRNAMLPLLDAEERACAVTQLLPYQTTFTRASQHRWISQAGPEGTCKVLRTETFDEDSGGWLWTYTLTEVIGNVDSQSCPKLGPQTEVCSWKYPNAALMNCEEVHFSPW